MMNLFKRSSGSARQSSRAVGRREANRANPFAFEIAHRRLAWSFRICVFALICVTAIAVSLSATIAALLPLRETRVALIKADPADDRLYQVLPVAQQTDGFRLAMESAARNYVRSLLEIDGPTQAVRWKASRLLTDGKFWAKWHDAHASRVRRALEDGIEREVLIESSHQIERRPNEWLVAVDFMQVDKQLGEITQERRQRAYVRLVTRPQRVSESQRFENPLGITVLEITVKRLENGVSTNLQGGRQ